MEKENCAEPDTKITSLSADKSEEMGASAKTETTSLNAEKLVDKEESSLQNERCTDADKLAERDDSTNTNSTSWKADKLDDQDSCTEKNATSVDIDNGKAKARHENDDRKVHVRQQMNERAETEGKLKDDVGSNKIVDREVAPMEENENLCEEEEAEPVFDGTEIPGMEACRSTSSRSLELDAENQNNIWPEKAVALKNFVREKSVGAVSIIMRRLSLKRADIGDDVTDNENMEGVDSSKEGEPQEKSGERSTWNPFVYFSFSDNKEQPVVANDLTQPIITKGRVILYTKLGCQACKAARRFLYMKRLRYVEINIEVYPGRKLELERISGSSSVPKVFFNEVLIGGLDEMKSLDGTGKLKDKLDYLISEMPSPEAPLPPLSGEDDVSSSGQVDELAVVVKKMKDAVIVKDRFYKMRWFSNCFVGSEAVDFISEDQYLEREEAVEFGRKLASKLFFHHILEENVFEDGNHFYRFLDQDPIVASQCYNIPRGIREVKPKPITEIGSTLRFLCDAIFIAYTSEDRRHVDYRSIHGSEEFARYLRTVEELQRVELHGMSREEKLAFFINLYNMMSIHAILMLGHPAGALERRKMFGDFKYVIGGCTYSLSAIHNGILRANQRPPYTLMKPFGMKDKRAQVALPYPEPLIHFVLVSGSRSGPAIQSYSPGNIDKELMESARNFLRNGGLSFDLQNKVVYASKILKWFSVDFGKNEVEVLKHASNYLETTDSEVLLELLSNTQLKVVYQVYDWGLNC